MNKGLLIVFSGPSGCGKGTILKQFLARNEDVRVSVSATTRAPREGEQEGVSYFFKTKEEFEELARSGGMLEYATYVGNSYGTPRASVEAWREEGYHVVLEIEVQGALQVKRNCPDALLVFVLPPSFEELERRLTGRGTEEPQVVARRLAMAKEELESAGQYDYILVNDVVEEAVADLETIVNAEQMKTPHMQDFLKGLCEV